MGYTILFAEDMPDDRIAVADFLRTREHHVIEVVNPKQAMECLAEHKTGMVHIDIIILDLVMPEDNPKGGVQVLTFMQAEGIIVPTIIASAWGYDGPAREAEEACPDAVRRVMTKTFLPDELLREIEDVLEQADASVDVGRATEAKAAKG